MEGEFPEQMKCPICFEIPEKEIFQCKNGHTICDICVGSVQLCPQCRVNLNNENKIRNRALEELLDMIKYHCSFKAKGCKEKVARKAITEHFESCEFGGKSAEFCKFLGFDCNFKINTRRLNASCLHLLDAHRAISKTGNFIEARFVNFSELDRNLKIVWRPTIINVCNENLIVVVSYKSDNLAVACFSINQLSNNFLVEFRFQAKFGNVPDIRWITQPICFTQAENIVRFPPQMSSVNLLHGGYLENNNLLLHIFVHGDRFPCREFQSMLTVDMHAPVNLRPATLPKVQLQQPKMQFQQPKLQFQQPKMQNQQPKMQFRQRKMRVRQPKISATTNITHKTSNYGTGVTEVQPSENNDIWVFAICFAIAIIVFSFGIINAERNA